jgi:DNA-binding response OmpR family regulator
VKLAEVSDPPKRADVKHDAKSTPSTSSLLIADDDAELINLLKAVLRNHFDCSFVSNGTAALDFLQHSQPDLVLLDINMPGMNGLEVLRCLRNRAGLQHLRVALLTAQTDSTYINAAASMGADGYIIKPFQVTTIVQRIRSILSLPRRSN